MPAKLTLGDPDTVDDVATPDEPVAEVVTPPDSKDDTKPGKKLWTPFDWKAAKKTPTPVKPPKAGNSKWAAYVWGGRKAK